MICSEDECCGCGTCMNVCPKQCITLKENSVGCLVPKINTENCIECGLCLKSCPKINTTYKQIPIVCYAAYKKNSEERMDCASGGVAHSFYKYCTINAAWSCVGVKFDEKLHAIMVMTDNQKDINDFKGSKYVQAYPGRVYKETAVALKSGKKVLFVGMPCQVAGCIRYLDSTNINCDKLVTVDLLCHGVAPQKYLDENIESLTQKYKWHETSDLTFRSNRKFKNYHFSLKNGNSGRNGNWYNRYSVEDAYFCGFLKGITLRESCYTCSFSSLDRVADVTIGDFIGLGSTDFFEGQAHNASLILCNTPRGLSFVQEATKDCYLYERSVDEAYCGGTSLQKPFEKSMYRAQFLENYTAMGFNRAFDKAIGRAFLKERLICSLRRMVFAVLSKIKGIQG